MFPTGSGSAEGRGTTGVGAPSAVGPDGLAVVPDVLAVAREALAECVPAAGSAEMIEQVRALEELRGLLSAVQASVTAAFVSARKAEQVAAGWPKRRVGVGLGQELGLAKRESPFKAGRYAGWASILTSELPHTFAALRAGQTSEWRAMIVARETGWLSPEDRMTIDADLGPRLGLLGDLEVEAEAKRLAYKLDPQGLVERRARAARYRHVSVRPALEGMSRLSALVPLTQGVAAFAALGKAADSARAAGDERSRGQVMADTLIERVTGQSTADGVPIMVDLIITDQALFGTGPDADEPATVPGYGPVPAPVARDWIARAAGAAGGTESSESSESPAPDETPTPNEAPAPPAAPAEPPPPASVLAAGDGLVRIRRLFTDPAGRLVSMETRSRFFTPAMAAFIRLRDGLCTTPYCGAAIRQIDHTLPWHDGGLTSLINAGGKCASCNQAKEAPGWTISIGPDGTLRITTPTGHDQATFTRTRPPSPPPPDTAAPPGTTAPSESMVTPAATASLNITRISWAELTRERKPPRRRRQTRPAHRPTHTDR